MSLPAPDQLKAALESRVPGAAIVVEGMTLVVEPNDLLAVCRALQADAAWQIDYVANLTAVDYPAEQRLDVVYHLYSMARTHGPVTLRVPLARATPAVSSVTPIWRGAEFQEREVYDLFGVRFEQHPDLRRILMWDGFEGYPMRKDYVVENQDAAEPAA